MSIGFKSFDKSVEAGEEKKETDFLKTIENLKDPTEEETEEEKVKIYKKFTIDGKKIRIIENGKIYITTDIKKAKKFIDKGNYFIYNSDEIIIDLDKKKILPIVNYLMGRNSLDRIRNLKLLFNYLIIFWIIIQIVSFYAIFSKIKNFSETQTKLIETINNKLLNNNNNQTSTDVILPDQKM